MALNSQLKFTKYNCYRIIIEFIELCKCCEMSQTETSLKKREVIFLNIFLVQKHVSFL